MKILPHVVLFLLFFSSKLVFAQDPTATVTSSDISFCQSGDATLTVEFEGVAPFNFMYEIDGSYQLGSALQDIYSNSYDLVISNITSSTDINVVRVYDELKQYNSDKPLNSGVAVNNQGMHVHIDQMPTPSAGSDKIIDNNTGVCGYEYQLQGTVNDPTHDISWNLLTGEGAYDDINSPTATFTKGSEGRLTFILTEIDGACTATDEVVVDFLGNPTAEIISDSEYKFCSTDLLDDKASFNIEFTGNAPFKYTINSDAEKIATASSYAVDYPVSTSQTLALTKVVDAYGCEASSLSGEQVVADLKPTPSAGSDDIACGTEYILQASLGAGNSGEWISSLGDIFDDPTNKNAKATNDSYSLKQDVTFTWTEIEPEMSCESSDDVVITYVEYPKLNIPVVSDQICDGNSSFMDYSLSGNHPWNITYNDGSITDVFNGVATATGKFELTPSFDNTMNLQSQTIYEFTRVVDRFGCATDYSNEKIYTVNVDERPTVNIGIEDKEICGRTITFTPQETIVDGMLSGAGTFTEQEDGKTMFEASDFGSQVIDWSVYNGACNGVEFVDSKTINFKRVPEPVNAGDDMIIYGTLNFNINADEFDDPNGEMWGEWTSIELTDIKSSNENNSDVSVGDYGTYHFVWTTGIDGLECPDYDLDDTIQVKVKKLIIPTGFSPHNSDGLYDCFKIYGVGNLNNTRLSVFDTRGKLVYKCDDCNQVWGDAGWDGIGINGSMVPEGTYYLVFEADELSEPRKQYLIIK